jgi:hypothetical protein
MRRRKIAGAAAWIVLIGGFSALFFFGWQMFKIRLETGDSYPEYSTYRADPKGLKAFYESLQGTDQIQARRRLQNSKILPSGENQLLVVAGLRADQQIVSEEDSQLFDHWLATGGRLLIALGPEPSQTLKTSPSSPTIQEESNPSSVPWQILIRRWGAQIAPLSDIRSATASSPLFGPIPRWLGRNFFARLTPEWKVIAVQDGKEVIVERAFGQGSIILLADSYPLSNEALATDRNTGFLLWLIDNRRGVLFDETHLGLTEHPGIMTLANRFGLQGTLFSFVAVLLLFIWKCQYALVPRPKLDQNSLIVSGHSSEQAFLNLLPRAVPSKDLLKVCISTWLQTARPTPAQLSILEEFRSDPAPVKPILERYNRLTALLNEKV